MEVILLKDVDNVGLRGDVVSVARGFARNFLFPRQLAEEATAARVSELKKREGQRARHEAKNADEAQAIAAKLGSTELNIAAKGAMMLVILLVFPEGIVGTLKARGRDRKSVV